MTAKGRKPTAAQKKLLMTYHKNPTDWLYVGQEVFGSDGYRHLGKEEEKTVRYKFIHRITGQEISLEE